MKSHLLLGSSGPYKNSGYSTMEKGRWDVVMIDILCHTCCCWPWFPFQISLIFLKVVGMLFLMNYLDSNHIFWHLRYNYLKLLVFSDHLLFLWGKGHFLKRQERNIHLWIIIFSAVHTYTDTHVHIPCSGLIEMHTNNIMWYNYKIFLLIQKWRVRS